MATDVGEFEPADIILVKKLDFGLAVVSSAKWILGMLAFAVCIWVSQFPLDAIGGESTEFNAELSFSTNLVLGGAAGLEGFLLWMARREVKRLEKRNKALDDRLRQKQKKKG